GIAVAAALRLVRGKRDLGEIGRARDQTKNAQERRRTRERVFLLRGEQMLRRALQNLHAVLDAQDRRTEGGVFQLGDPARGLAITGDRPRERLAAGEADLAADEVDGLNAVRAFINRGDTRIAVELRGTRFLDEA